MWELLEDHKLMTEEACGPKQPRRSLQRAYARSHHTPPDPTHHPSSSFSGLSFGSTKNHRRKDLRRSHRRNIFRRTSVSCFCVSSTHCVCECLLRLKLFEPWPLHFIVLSSLSKDQIALYYGFFYACLLLKKEKYSGIKSKFI